MIRAPPVRALLFDRRPVAAAAAAAAADSALGNMLIKN